MEDADGYANTVTDIKKFGEVVILSRSIAWHSGPHDGYTITLEHWREDMAKAKIIKRSKE